MTTLASTGSTLVNFQVSNPRVVVTSKKFALSDAEGAMIVDPVTGASTTVVFAGRPAPNSTLGLQRVPITGGTHITDISLGAQVVLTLADGSKKSYTVQGGQFF